jgi:hypothetical protein
MLNGRPVIIDVFCGLGGWSKGFLSEGWDCYGFDIERHQYGDKRYPGQLILQDALTLHGSQFRFADAIVASPPCQRYSYMAMPWTRAKQQAAEIRADTSGVMLADLNALFNCCFRLQKEACQAAGRYIPLVVENVKGAQPWVGRAAWHYGSFYLWGDVPALMPDHLTGKGPGGSWFYAAEGRADPREGGAFMLRSEAIKQSGIPGALWFDNGMAKFPSRSARRKAASAQIAEIPFDLSQWIARCFKPVGVGVD